MKGITFKIKIAKNPKHGRYQRGLASMAYQFFNNNNNNNKKTGLRANVNEVLPRKLDKPGIKKFKEG